MIYKTNADFIKKYGKYEFRFLKDSIYITLLNYKNRKVIRGFKLHNTKGYATIYFNVNGKSVDVNLQYGTIYGLSEKELIHICITKLRKEQQRSVKNE